MTNNEDSYVDFSTNRAEPLYGNTQEKQIVYGNIGSNGNEQSEEHYMSYHKNIDKDEDADDYMDLVTTNKTTQQHSNKTNNAMEENHYGNIITEDPLYGNLTPKP